MRAQGISKGWVVGAFALTWFAIFAYGAWVLVRFAPRLWPDPGLGYQMPVPRGRLLARDGTPLALSPKPGERRYPLGALAGQLIGYTERFPKGFGRGLAGLEARYDAVLARGEDVRLTLDPKIQALAETALLKGVKAAKARWGSLVVLSPEGEVLASANVPRLDPASRRGAPGKDPRLTNYAWRYLIEPGSTVKPLVAAWLLDRGAVRPGEGLEVPARLKVGDRWVRDWRWHPLERWTLADVLAHSSNVGMALLAERVDKRALHAFLKTLGFGRRVHPLAERPLLPALKRWGPVEKANAAFGQGFALPPVQLAAAMNALIDGIYRPPVVVLGQKARGRRLFSAKSARWMRATLSAHLASRARVPGYRLAGKTGTAQIPTRGGYDPERVVALFAGFIPADRPRATAVVVLYDPQVPPADRYGSKLAAPVFAELAKGLLSYWGLPPERVK